MSTEDLQLSATQTAPVLTFPAEEAAIIRRYYREAQVILEYGSGGSTYLAASLPGKFVMSVESSLDWATVLQAQINAADLPSPAVVYHVDIGPTGSWGRPQSTEHWSSFYRYPTRIWTESFFRVPDLILIDGRFRASCFVASLLRITKPTTLLFDDYTNRAAYHVVEKLAKPARFHGRMAEFLLIPGERPMWVHDLFNELLGDVADDTHKPARYRAKPRLDYPFNQI